MGNKRIPFIVQQSVLPFPLPPLHAFELYDLKGQKNRAKKATSSDKKRPLRLQILKEGDFNRKINFALPESATLFVGQLKKDLQVRDLMMFCFVLFLTWGSVFGGRGVCRI